MTVNYDGRFETLVRLLKKQGDSFDHELIKKAYDIAIEKHEGQKRLSGEPFFIHPFSVACITAKLGMDTESVAAALLHDAVEDTDLSLDDVKRDFGETIAMLVDGVTKLGKINYVSKEELQAENVRKMFIAMSEDIRVIIIKLCDRLHNMRTIDAQTELKQLDKSRETLEIYAPIAHRLGIRAVKEELEDLAIKHLDPVAYADIEGQLEKNKEYRLSYIESIKDLLREKLDESIPNLSIEGRVKSIHGIYRKMYMQSKQFEEIYDIYAVRVIVNTVTDCYNVLGMVHEMFRPIPGRFKDYISTPKSNMYQSLHTTVIGKKGAPFEVQIRTWDMHYTAEYGIAAHWKYKEGVSGSDERFEERLAWIRRMLDNQSESDDIEEIVRTIKTDLAPEDVFCVTPGGDLISLPAGATAIDFAYAIHSAVGNRMIGAKANGRIVPIDYVISTGDVVEILTTNQQGHGPSRDWLKIVKTSEARSKIRAWFKKERYAENVEEGQKEVEREFRRASINLSDKEMEKFIADIAERQHCSSIEDFYNKIGYGGIILSRIMPRIREDYLHKIKVNQPVDISGAVMDNRATSRSHDGVEIEGIDNCLIKLSRCCNPIPGDNIVGFITRGHGVSIHKRECPNVPNDLEVCDQPERWIPARWGEQSAKEFVAGLYIFAFDRFGLLADVTTAIANMRVLINRINTHALKNGNYSIELEVKIESQEQIKAIIAKLSKIDGIISVDRKKG
ncbi:MAG: bifunctional (p)ppGpp synthetase/guanosine-3',5'-bis(diphosphate) 3'-pyrophosphohydrolase [Clostridia bacterium]|nr:bifunctional (p)ppGpp synthetase/guanosine-3',5'-bis(diphosphate) 3'-pyrophosphohydrolase [Clostridia bacterium]